MFDMKTALMELIMDVEDDTEIKAEYKANKLLENGVIFCPVNVGDTVWCVSEDDEGVFIESNKVTEVCSKGFFVSSFNPPQDDLGSFEPYEQLGKNIFLCEFDAKLERERR